MGGGIRGWTVNLSFLPSRTCLVEISRGSLMMTHVTISLQPGVVRLPGYVRILPILDGYKADRSMLSTDGTHFVNYSINT